MSKFPTHIIIIFLLIALCCHACIPGTEKSSETDDRQFAEHFILKDYGEFKILQIINPWQKAYNIKFSYCLTDHPGNVPDSLLNLPVIKTPVERLVVFSTTHVGFLKALSTEGKIIGASGANYIFDPGLIKKYRAGSIAEIGYPPSVNFEKILELKPDLVFLYGLESSISNISQRIESAGINTILIADYLEQHPLGKMEWIKVFAALTGKSREADSLFNEKVANYTRCKAKIERSNLKNPTVLLGLPWKDTWYMAGGASYTARLIKDAGGNYLWANNKSDEYIPLSVEAVMAKAMNADFWINPGSIRSLEEIIERDSRYKVFEPFKNGNVFANDLQLNSTDANNFWEKGVVEPDLILMDLIKILHPELMNEHDFVYYRKLE